MVIKSLKLLLCLSVACLFSSCRQSGSIHAELQRAETLMSEYPDSSLQIIYGIDTLALTNQSDIALYSLLRTQAEDKNYIDAEDDSRILRAVDYYANSRDIYHKMLSYYYAGRVEENAGEYSKAIVNQMMAETSALELGDYFYLGLIYRAFSNIYCDVYSNVESMKYAQKSYESFVKSGKEKYINWALVDLARSYNNGGEYNECERISKLIVEKAQENNDNLLLSRGLKYLGDIYLADGKNKESIAAYTRLFEECPDWLELSDYRNIGIAYLRDNQLDNAELYKDYVEKNDNSDNWLSYEFYAKNKDFEKAYFALEKEYQWQYGVVRKVLEQNVTETVMLHKELEQQQKDIQLTSERKSKAVWVLVCILIIVLLSVVLWQRNVAYKKEILAKMTMMSQLQYSLSDSKGKNESLQSVIDALYGHSFKAVDELCSEYYSGNDKSSVVKKVGAIIRGFKEDGETIAQLEEFVNAYRKNVMYYFRMDFPNLKDADYKLFLYLAAGFSLRTISIFLDSELGALYSRKSRLKQKINSSVSNFKEEFMEIVV